jgi:hypothetical protein
MDELYRNNLRFNSKSSLIPQLDSICIGNYGESA